MTAAPDRRLARNGDQRHDPAKPRLVAEWALVIALPRSGIAWRIPADSQGDAFARGRRCGHATWHVEKRYVGPWLPVTPELRTALLEVGRAKPLREFDLEPDDDDEQITVAFVQEPGTGNGSARE